MRRRSCVKVCLAVVLSVPSIALFAQTKNCLDATIRQQDAVFWDAHNRSELDKMSEWFWPDIEFYHGKGGLSDDWAPGWGFEEWPLRDSKLSLLSEAIPER